MTTTEKKKRLDYLLKTFDWYYQRTEDRRVYHYWMKVSNEITQLRRELAEDGEYLFKKYHSKQFPELY